MPSSNISNGIPLILYYFDKEYRLKHPDVLLKVRNRSSVWLDALRIAEENGLLYYFSRRLLEDGIKLSSKFSLRVDREKGKLVTFKRTLVFARQLFEDEGIDFMFIKLYKGLPYVPRDIDILVKAEQIQHTLSTLRRKGFDVRTFEGGVENECLKEGLMKIDLYQGFYYLSLQFIDEKFLWRHPRTSNICGVTCPIPSYDADLLILFIHALLGHRHLSLLDFLYAKSMFAKCSNLDNILQQTDKHKWTYAFFTMLSTIKNIHYKLYSTSTSNLINFPVIFSPKFILRAFQGFEGIPINEKKRILFVASTLMDSVLYRYQLLSPPISIEITEEVKNIILKGMHKVRHYLGDHKL
jgi:hypothetical protein